MELCFSREFHNYWNFFDYSVDFYSSARVSSFIRYWANKVFLQENVHAFWLLSSIQIFWRFFTSLAAKSGSATKQRETITMAFRCILFPFCCGNTVDSFATFFENLSAPAYQMIDFQFIALIYKGTVPVFPVHDFSVYPGNDVGEAISLPEHYFRNAEFGLEEFLFLKVDRHFHAPILPATTSLVQVGR